MKTSTLTPNTTVASDMLAQANVVFEAELEAIKGVQARLNQNPETLEKAVMLIEHCSGRVVITGMGKSGHIGKKMAATFASLGTPAFFMHPGEGVHGDLGMLNKGDVLIALSKSGETSEILQILPAVKHLSIPVIAMTGNIKSTLSNRAQVTLDIGVEQEACALNLAPTSSTTTTLVMGDALALVLSQRKGFTPTDFALFHPAGSLGKRLLLTVDEVMHRGEDTPVIGESASFSDALVEMTSKKLGMTAVVDSNGETIGVLTDGDVRRVLTQTGNIGTLKVKDLMSGQPKTIDKESLAAAALNLMEHHRITALVVNDENNHPIGVVHLHDLLKTGI